MHSSMAVVQTLSVPSHELPKTTIKFAFIQLSALPSTMLQPIDFFQVTSSTFGIHDDGCPDSMLLIIFSDLASTRQNHHATDNMKIYSITTWMQNCHSCSSFDPLYFALVANKYRFFQGCSIHVQTRHRWLFRFHVAHLPSVCSTIQVSVFLAFAIGRMT